MCLFIVLLSVLLLYFNLFLSHGLKKASSPSLTPLRSLYLLAAFPPKFQAYMAAKNVIGPVCIALAYGLLKAGGGSGSFIAQLATKLGLVSTGSGGSNGAAAAAAAAGDAAATLALACWCSTLLFPFVVRTSVSIEARKRL